MLGCIVVRNARALPWSVPLPFAAVPFCIAEVPIKYRRSTVEVPHAYLWCTAIVPRKYCTVTGSYRYRCLLFFGLVLYQVKQWSPTTQRWKNSSASLLEQEVFGSEDSPFFLVEFQHPLAVHCFIVDCMVIIKSWINIGVYQYNAPGVAAWLASILTEAMKHWYMSLTLVDLQIFKNNL